MWKGEKRQLKPVGVGPVLHPHPGRWGQLYPFCWTRLDLGFLGSPGFQAIPPWLSVPIFPGTPWEGCLCAPVAETLACFRLSLLLFTRVCEFIAYLSSESLAWVISKCQNLFLYSQTDSLQGLLLALGVQTYFLSFLARLAIPESAFISQGEHLLHT